jgi:hypothetical protein
MEIEDIRNQINYYWDKIEQVKEETSRKKNIAKKEINMDYSTKFEQILTDFKIKLKKTQKLNNKIKIRKGEKKALNFLNQEISSLSKKKVKDIKEKLKLINREKMQGINEYKNQIKNLKKKLKVLETRKFAKKWKRWSNF